MSNNPKMWCLLYHKNSLSDLHLTTLGKNRISTNVEKVSWITTVTFWITVHSSQITNRHVLLVVNIQSKQSDYLRLALEKLHVSHDHWIVLLSCQGRYIILHNNQTRFQYTEWKQVVSLVKIHLFGQNDLICT